MNERLAESEGQRSVELLPSYDCAVASCPGPSSSLSHGVSLEDANRVFDRLDAEPLNLFPKPSGLLGVPHGTSQNTSLVDAAKALESFLARVSGVGSEAVCSEDTPPPSAETIEGFTRAIEQVFLKAIGTISSSLMSETVDPYHHKQAAEDADQWVVASASQMIGGVWGQKAIVEDQANRATSEIARATAALQAGKWSVAAGHLEAAESAASKAHTAWMTYHEGVVSGAGEAVQDLRTVRDTANLTLSILAVVTGPAGESLALSTNAFTKMAEAGMAAALGQKVDVGALATDIVSDFVIAKLGGKLADGLIARVVRPGQIQTLAQATMQRIVVSVLVQQVSVPFKTAVEAVQAELSGKEVTWEKFMEALKERLLDPKAPIAAALAGALRARAELDLRGLGSTAYRQQF